jgi:hypothetical protein
MSSAIKQAVAQYQREHCVQPRNYHSRSEGSCFGDNEFRNLFSVQLVLTHYGYGDWQNIQPIEQNEQIIMGLYDWLLSQELLK